MARERSSFSLGTRTIASSSAVALHEAVQPQAERFGIQPVGLHPLVAFIQPLGINNVALDP